MSSLGSLRRRPRLLVKHIDTAAADFTTEDRPRSGSESRTVGEHHAGRARGFISKPFVLTEVVTRVSSLLEER